MTDPQLARVAQSLDPGAIVFLFELNTSVIGGPVYYFTPNRDGDNPVVFGGVTYTSADIEASDFEVSGNGSLPTPKIRISNTDGLVQQIVNQYGDLVGCSLRRVRTFARFLDGKPDADPSSYFGPDIFRVERKVAEDGPFFEWELSAAIDQEGKMLPGRQVLRDFCSWRYRVWNPQTNTFDYSKATCPYTASSYFTAEGEPTTAANDRCGKRVSECERRFGAGNPLPFGGFPGVSRVRQ